MKPRGPLLVAAHLPPPVHGMSLVSEAMTRRLALRFETEVIDTSPGSLTRGARYHLRKARAIRRVYARLAASPTPGAMYLPLDAGWGLAYARLLAGRASRVGAPIVVHHHNRSYIAARDRRVEGVLRALESEVHVFLSDGMRADFIRVYGPVANSQVLGNAGFLEPSEGPPRRPSNVGVISNLSRMKGLEDALGLLDEPRFEGRLHVAGPADDWAEERLAEASNRWGSRLEVWGPVDGDRKRRFWEAVGTLVFPSRLAEAQPLTILEAFAHGIPVVAREGEGVRDLIGECSSWIVPADVEFACEAMIKLDTWRSEPAEYARARRLASTRFADLRERGIQEFEALVETLKRCVSARREPR